jgi:hypothetical protein
MNSNTSNFLALPNKPNEKIQTLHMPFSLLPANEEYSLLSHYKTME